MVEEARKPEQFSPKPPTLLKQIKDALEKDRLKNQEVGPAFLIKKISDGQGPTMVGTSKITEESSIPSEAKIHVCLNFPRVLNIRGLNDTTKLLLKRLKEEGISVTPDEVILAKRADEKGGITYPVISFPGETLRRITYTKQTEVLTDDGVESKHEPNQNSTVEIKRSATKIVIYPNELAADLALADWNALPKEFRTQFLDTELTEKQLRLLKLNKVELPH